MVSKIIYHQKDGFACNVACYNSLCSFRSVFYLFVLKISIVVRFQGAKVRFAPSAAFQDLQNSFPSASSFFFLDQEKEICLVRNDAELRGALFHMRETKELSLSVEEQTQRHVAAPAAVRAAAPRRRHLDPSEKHELLGRLLDLGHEDMTANLKAVQHATTLQEALENLRASAIPAAPASVRAAAPRRRHLDPSEKHELLGRLLDLGHEDMTANLKAVQHATTLQEALENLRASASPNRQDIESLFELGFMDRERNIEALAHSSNLEEAVSILLSKDAPSSSSLHYHAEGNNNNS